MTFAELAVRSAFRNRLRTTLTTVGVAIAVIAFLFLRTIVGSFSSGVDNAAQDRMVVRNKVAIIFPLPMAYRDKVRAVPGIDDITWSNWFGGVYQNPRNFFPRFAVDAESYLRMYPEFVLEPAEKAAFMADRTGCVIGAGLAAKYNFKIGDVIPFQGDIFPGEWKFTVRAIYHGRERGTDDGLFFFHWKYLDESLNEARKNLVGTFLVHVADAKQSTQVGQAVDALFANSVNETRTESERSFQLSFLAQLSTIVTALDVVAIVMLAILTLILGNTMAMSTRERTSEYAVMRSIGFHPSHIIGLVLAEAAVVALAGFALGVAIAQPLIQGFSTWGQKQFGTFLRGTDLSLRAVAWAGIAALVGAILATGVPAVRAGRLKIVDALRRVE